MGTTSDKLTYLNTTKGKIKDVINMTGANITSDTIFRNYATKLYDGYVSVLKDKDTLLDNMPKGTSTGNITDAADLPVYEDKMSKGSTQDGTPSPENPVEIKTVKGYRNLFDKSSILDGYALNRNDNTLSTGSTYRTSDYCEVEPNTTYYLGMYFVSNNYGILFYDENKTWLSSIAPANSFTTPENTKYIRFSWVKGNWDLDAIQLTESTEELPYVPYGTNWIYTAVSDGTDTNYYTIPLNDNEIAGIGDYKDELIVDKNGKCWLNKKIGKLVLNGSESGWSYASVTQGSLFRYVSVRSVINKIPMSNYFVGLPNNTNRENGKFYYNNAIIGFDFIYNSFDNLNDFKTWLSTHNTEVYYVLAAENLIDLNYTVDIELFKGINNISNSDDMDMEIKYIKDTYE